MNVLAIETSGLIGSVAACRDGATLAEEKLEKGMQHGRLLLPLVDSVVAAAGWDRQRDIHLVAVSQGPGSFTGLRVGIACAKTIAHQLGRPIVGVCSLRAMAENAPEDCRRVLTVLDAKRGDVYAAAFERREGRLAPVQPTCLLTPEAAALLLQPPYLVMGDGLRHHADSLCRAGGQPADEDLWRIRASIVARLGLLRFESGHADSAMAIEPVYLRLPEAEEKRLQRERGRS